ncbi:MAG: alpha-amylase family glycosyl hydrolase [Euryarchaeota archaeon]|nr:alpha-amylase family glycosyl hydrolase [Euryarchaeota archaeon]
MSVIIEQSAPVRLSDAVLKPRGRVHPSPSTWRDQVLYFLLPDRFSDGREAERPLFDRSDPERHRADKRRWMEGGKVFQGGTIRGIQSKLSYLRDIGVTALWIGPIWRQRPDMETYHGYGIQNFLDIDPRFGTRQDLRDLVDAAHDMDMYVLLDVIYNHSGNNWFYSDATRDAAETMPYRFQPPYPFAGWRSKTGQRIDRIAEIDDGVLPEEFQDQTWYTRAGKIGRWDPEPWEDPLHPDVEFRRGDFFDLKDINLARNNVLSALIRVYQYWIALSDCDGFRIDTVKHTTWEGSRNFCGAIHEYAESIGKDNFLLLGEVTGGARMTRKYLEIFGRNIDAALDIGEPTIKLAEMVKGLANPDTFFRQFGDHSHDSLGSHREAGRYHVSILDDHDMVGRPGKHRFSAHVEIPNRYQQVAHALGVQLTTLGIPCIYYGTEQAFDGTEDRHDEEIEPCGFEDRYIRECMFGGTSGAFETEGCHFFDQDHPTYLRIAAIARIRNRDDQIGMALRRGRQYLRETSFLDRPFSIPGRGELVAWSRILFEQEVLIALNTHGTEDRGADVTVHAGMHPEGSKMRFLYRGDWSDAELRNPPVQIVPVKCVDGHAVVRIDLPPAGMAIIA